MNATDWGTLTCPHCQSSSLAAMPRDACMVLWSCPRCAQEVKPKAGDCCVFCSYGDRPCPPVQQAKGLF